MNQRQLRWVCLAIALGLGLCSLPQVGWARATPQDERGPSEWIAALRGDERELAIAALARLGKTAAGPLGRALEDADAELAWQIARAFRALGKQGAQAAARLTILVRDAKQPAQRRACAAAAIGSLGEAGKGSARALVDALAKRSPPELELQIALALCEIGDGAAQDLGNALGDGDLRVRLWAVSSLVATRTRTSSVNKSIVRVAESLAVGKEREDYLLQPAAERILERDGIPFAEPVDLVEYLAADLELRSGKAVDKGDILLLRGGRLDDGLRTSPDAVRELLLDELDLAEKSGSHPLALPASFSDWDGDGAFTAGELVRSLALHLTDVLAERTAALHGGSNVTYSDWTGSSAEALGLVAALQALLDREFLEKSRYLELFFEPFNGFRAPTDADGY